MMINCDIQGIKIKLNYRYDTYFKGSIEKWQTDLKAVDHILETKYYQTDIQIPDDLEIRILAGHKGAIKTLLTYDKAFRHATIHIDERKFNQENLANAEYVYMSMVFLEIAYLYHYFPMHGSAMAYKGEAFIISAPSGTGKSTHTNMWQEVFGANCLFVNDDKPLIKLKEDKLYVLGSPFSGAHVKNETGCYPLKALVFLNQGLTNEIRKTETDDAILKIMRNSLRPKTNETWDQTLEIMDQMIEKLAIYDMDATLSHDAVFALKFKLFGAL